MTDKSSAGRDRSPAVWGHRSAGNLREGAAGRAADLISVVPARGSGCMVRARRELLRAQRVANDSVEPEDLDWLCRGFSAFLACGGKLPLERCLRLPTNERALRRARRDHWLRRAWMLLDGTTSSWRRSEMLATESTGSRSRSGPAGHRWITSRRGRALWTRRSSRHSDRTNGCRGRPCSFTTSRAIAAPARSSIQIGRAPGGADRTPPGEPE